MVRSAFQDHFAQIPSINKPRSTFKRVSRHKTTFNEGFLVPFYLDEVLPGDTFNVRCNAFARMATPIFPVMDNAYLEMFWFFVPTRLVWDNFVKQHGERANPSDSVDYTTPVFNPATLIGTDVGVGSLWDYFGLPIVGQAYLSDISCLPFRAYNLIHNEWFRDQNLMGSITIPTGDGPDNMGSNYNLRYVCKFKDYFTTALPQPQKGPDVELPMAVSAPVERVSNAPGWLARTALANTAPANGAVRVTAGGLDNSAVAISLDPNGGLLADLQDATGVPTINEWREAVVIQQAYELDMRGGTRFIEMLYNHYGVVNPDFRLQRPEFLGYQRNMVNVHPVPQTSETATETPQGNLAAFATVSASGTGFNKAFTEFGFVMGLMAVRTDLTYQQGVDRLWTRRTRFDYAYPQFSNLGEQAILNKEIWVNPSAATGNDGVFGYQERFAEYRFKTSKITGLFRSDAAQSLDAWHYSEDFSSLPTLSQGFIIAQSPISRTVAVQDEPHFIFDCHVENNTTRVMPMYSVPGLTRL